MNTHKVLTRSIYGKTFRTFAEVVTLEEALAIATRLRKNTSELEVVVDLPDNALQSATLELLA